MKHAPGLISALAHETSKMYTSAGEAEAVINTILLKVLPAGLFVLLGLYSQSILFNGPG